MADEPSKKRRTCGPSAGITARPEEHHATGRIARSPPGTREPSSDQRWLVERQHRSLRWPFLRQNQPRFHRPGRKQRRLRGQRQPRRRMATFTMMMMRSVLVRCRRAIRAMTVRMIRCRNIALAATHFMLPGRAIVEVCSGRAQPQPGERAEKKKPLQEPEHRRKQTSRASAGQGKLGAAIHRRFVERSALPRKAAMNRRTPRPFPVAPIAPRRFHPAWTCRISGRNTRTAVCAGRI